MDTSGERFVDGRLNLWRGFGVEPKPGEWPLLRRHILDVLCSGNKEHARYMARWIAWGVQNPIKQSEVALVLGGDKGTGKGKFLRLLCRLFGTHARIPGAVTGGRTGVSRQHPCRYSQPSDGSSFLTGLTWGGGGALRGQL